MDEFQVIFIPLSDKLYLIKPTLKFLQDPIFIAWGYKNDEQISKMSDQFNIPLWRIEDGFIRSTGLGAMHTPPYSLCIDRKGMYFNSSIPSELEDILNEYNFDKDPELIDRAKKNINTLNEMKVSKYNYVNNKNVDHIYGPKEIKRILVVGQVEDDASIRKGSNKKWTNNELVRVAKSENPDAEIIYKPHPDVLEGKRQMYSNPKDVKHISKVIEEPLSIPDALNTIDHVYTITSLSGLEAILRNIPVTTVGAPFYSGWGLTDDRQPIARRRRTLTKEEVFAGAYILYPKYINPYTKQSITIEEAISEIANRK
ncbi:capsular polysaccharide export protein, LipB/KpsS family [Halobacillus salinus]|uniref:capsular polysaccharide export protein, LipB/KpsS family n=1 Tax=Halobacillus salinus TaxID=192814 RepID=UPI0020CA36F9|nr:capsular polysaccharide biosynthesis protein [Halobacillus salinus]